MVILALFRQSNVRTDRRGAGPSGNADRVLSGTRTGLDSFVALPYGWFDMINFVNRIIATVVLIVLILVLIAVAVTPEGVAQLAAGILAQVRVDPFSVSHLIIAVACVVLVAIFLWLLRQEFRRERIQAVPLTTSGGAAGTTIATESVVQRLRQDVEQVPDVRQVIPVIQGGSRGVTVLLDVRTEPHVDVPAKASEIDQVARDSLARLGVRLNQLRVKLQVARGASSSSSTPSS